ncbi:hypothetical protein MRB53_040716 [Persea americana]|nr:hypothetical protein MRB53_040716 [Persea americana]
MVFNKIRSILHHSTQDSQTSAQSVPKDTNMSKKVIVVIGATGSQGGSVARTFAQLPGWHVRGISRDTTSDGAQALTKLGVEVVKADLQDKASLSKAFAGAHAIFVNTDFMIGYRDADPDKATKMAYDLEYASGKNAVDAAADIATLERFIYSSLTPVKRADKTGKYSRAAQTEVKAAVKDYIEQAHPALYKKTSFIYPGDLWFPVINPKTSLGPFTRALVEDEAPMTTLLAYDSSLTIDGIVQTWSKVNGKEAILYSMTLEQLHEVAQIPWVLLDFLGGLQDVRYDGGIERYIQPKDLKTKVITPSFEEYLRTQSKPSA